jgi:hypothetical protein
MKKLSIFVLALMVWGNTFANKVYKEKSNGGFFGYKTVEQTEFNNGDVYLNCKDPGYTRCRAISTQRLVYNGQTVDISPTTQDAIDLVVMNSISETNTNGRLVHDGNIFISYIYNPTTNKLNYFFCLLEEAIAEGLI